MNGKLEEIIKIKPTRVSRKTYLEPLAKRLKIDPEKYKNRTVLHRAICDELQYKKPSSRCDNACDPITLEDIDEIDKSFLFEWDQNDVHYGADIRSLKAMIAQDVTILPWAIDKASGIESANDREKYLAKYDLKNVKGLLEEIGNEKYCVEYNFEYEKVPDHVKYRFQILNCTNEYITSLVDFVENYQEFKKLYHHALQLVCNQFHGEMYEGNGMNMKNIFSLNLLSRISETVSESPCNNSLELLAICINTIKVYFESNYQNIIDLLFMMLNTLKNEIDK